MQVLRQGLRANVLAGALAGKDMTASWPRAEHLLSGDQLLHERREGHAKWPSLLHVLSWYVDRVFCDPRLLERSILARTEHRAEREEEEHALERCLLSVLFYRVHGADDEWGGDLVELTIADRLDDVALEATAFVLVAHDLGLFEAAPETKSVFQYIALRWLKPDVLSQASGFLSCLREIYVWVFAELFVGDTAR